MYVSFLMTKHLVALCFNGLSVAGWSGEYELRRTEIKSQNRRLCPGNYVAGCM